MGTFKVHLEVANRDLVSAFEPVEALVDTGSLYSKFPGFFLEKLGVERSERERFQLADKTYRYYDIGQARMRLDGRERTSVVVFGEDGIYLLGAVSLEEFGLIPDTTSRKLVEAPTPPMILSMAPMPRSQRLAPRFRLRQVLGPPFFPPRAWGRAASKPSAPVRPLGRTHPRASLHR